MDSQIKYSKMKRGDETKASKFISVVFNEYVAPGFSQDGIDEFMKYIKPDALASQLKENHFAFIATVDAEILGIIEVRNYNHVALFFVDGRFQRKGIGRKLLQKALELCNSNDSEFSKLTVNASPNSIMAYETLGFEAADGEQCINGIRFVPMALRM
jgi:GNAT superfamily N-acetyltransferase